MNASRIEIGAHLSSHLSVGSAPLDSSHFHLLHNEQIPHHSRNLVRLAKSRWVEGEAISAAELLY